MRLKGRLFGTFLPSTCPPMFWIHASKEYRALHLLYDEAQALTAAQDATLYGPAASVSNWSPAQHLHHAESINQGILTALAQACQSDQPLPDDTTRTPYGYLFMVMGRFPRGQGRTPKRFEPPATPERAALRSLVAANRERMDTIEPHLGALRQIEGRLTHPIFGGLDALDWLRFIRIHTGHHHAIIRDILDAQPASA